MERRFEEVFRKALYSSVNSENWKYLQEHVDDFIKDGICQEESRSDVLNAIFVEAFLQNLSVSASFILNRRLAPEEVDRAYLEILKVLREKRLGI